MVHRVLAQPRICGYAAATAEPMSMTLPRRVLPVLLRICADIDSLFIVEVGPFGKDLAEDARAAWLDGGNKTKPADATQYVTLLAQNIADPARREAFTREASQCIHL